MVRVCDIKKWALFLSNHKTYVFRVMPFRPVNAPSFYTYMMGNFKVEQDALFLDSMKTLATPSTKLDGASITIHGDAIFLGDHKLNSGTCSIIDDILIWSSNISSILIYLECVCKVF